MSTLLIDGFDHYGTVSDGATAMLSAFYVEVPETVNPSNPVGPDVPSWGTRTGFASLGTGGSVGGDCYRATLPASQTNILVSMGFSVSNLPSVDSDQGICSFRDGSNQVLAGLWLTTTGALELRGPYTTGPFVAGTVQASSISSVIRPQVWHFLEMEIDTAARSFVLRVDDGNGLSTPVINKTSLSFGKTVAGATVATSPMVSLALLQRAPTGAPSVVSAWIDDLVVRNNTGTNSTFAGTTYIATTYPTSSQIAPLPLAAVTSYASVDLPVAAISISSTAIVITGYKTSAGAASLTPSFIGPLKGVTAGATNVLTGSSKYYTTIFDISPDGGQLMPITLAKGGFKVTPVTVDSAPQLQQLVELSVYQTCPPVQVRQWSWTFTLDGHTFYVLDLGAEGTFAYDIITKQWCHLYTQGFGGQWNFANGTMWGDRIVAGDLLYNIVWELDPNQSNDEGWRTIKHVVTGGISTRSRAWSGCAFLRLVGSSGVTQSVTPVVMTLSFSDDNGKLWSPEFPMTINADDTELDIQWPSLGSFSTPGRIFRITDTGGLIRIDGADVSLSNFKETNNDGDR